MFPVVRDDIKRHRADDEVNNKPVAVLNKETQQFENVPQCLVRVGDIVKVYEGDIFPADMLFLRSGDPKAFKSCWVNTKSLDGETDNKYRQAMKVEPRVWVSQRRRPASATASRSTRSLRSCAGCARF